MNYNSMISVASWEDRYELGIKHFLKNNYIKKLIIFNFVDFSEETKINTKNLISFLNTQSIEHELVNLYHNCNIDNWKIVKNTFKNITGSLVIDLSTMPRDIIYFSLYHADKSDNIEELYCLYNCPENYSNDKWLTKDPRKPQLVYNMSGIFEMGKNTIVIIITGFDRKRIEQLLNYYEPQKVYMGLQTGKQYENNILNIKQHEEYFKSFLEIEYFYLDAFSKNDHGLSAIEEIIKNNIDSNIIIASLGPKPSSISLFQINKKNPNIGLVYIPVTTYNMSYSFGIDLEKVIFERIK